MREVELCQPCPAFDGRRLHDIIGTGAAGRAAGHSGKATLLIVERDLTENTRDVNWRMRRPIVERPTMCRDHVRPVIAVDVELGTLVPQLQLVEKEPIAERERPSSFNRRTNTIDVQTLRSILERRRSPGARLRARRSPTAPPF
jgi:hypothetical protein